MNLLIRAASAVAGLRGTSMMIAVVAVVSFGAGTYAGGKAFSVVSDAKQTNALKQSLSEEKIKLRELADRSRKREARATDSLSKMTLQLDSIRNETVTQKTEVIRYVKVNKDCNISNGAVRVLNEARTGNSGLPRATELSTEVERSASAIGQRDEIEAHVECGNEYRKLAARHDALVNWVSIPEEKDD